MKIKALLLILGFGLIFPILHTNIVLGKTTFQGVMKSGKIPIGNAKISLYAAGKNKNQNAELISSTTTNVKGEFTFENINSNKKALLYLIGEHQPAVRFAAVLGQKQSIPSTVTLNELTTIATAFSHSQFLSNTNIAGAPLGLEVATITGTNLVDVSRGEISGRLADKNNILMKRKFNTLGNILASCVNQVGNSCQQLSALTNNSKNTLEAAHNIARNPFNNVSQLYSLSKNITTYNPEKKTDRGLEDWSIALIHTGNGKEISGPGQIAFDGKGNLYVTNNFIPGTPSPGLGLTALTPKGDDLFGEPLTGGGIYGTGFGIGFAPNGHLWVGNFGFGLNCLGPNGPDKKCKGNAILKFEDSTDGGGISVSEFNPRKGAFVSPAATGNRNDPSNNSGGYTNNGISGKTLNSVQGTVSDQDGNIWIASYHGNALIKYVEGNPQKAKRFDKCSDGNPVYQPFDLAVDSNGNIFVASSSIGLPVEPPVNQVCKFDRRGNPLAIYPTQAKPLGLAIDSNDNVWVANNLGGSITHISPVGKIEVYEILSGRPGPWGITVDANGLVYIAGFETETISIVCGADKAFCPEGQKTGDIIGVLGGCVKVVNEILRITGVKVNVDGSLWAANNFKTKVLAPPNSGGDSILQFVGLAAPVKTPLIGPQQPLESGR